MTNYFPSHAQLSAHTIFSNISIHTLSGEKLMIAIVDLPPHSIVTLHQHPHEQMGLLLEGKAVFTIGGVEKTLQAGDCYYMPSNVPHKVVNLERPSRALDVFSPPREEYR
jgi:quercetin dioxygenase-like cupin family protein